MDLLVYIYSVFYDIKLKGVIITELSSLHVTQATLSIFFYQRLNWPPEDEARRIVVVVTDATPHIAGDGKV